MHSFDGFHLSPTVWKKLENRDFSIPSPFGDLKVVVPCIHISSPLTRKVYFAPFLSDSTSLKSVSAHPSVRPTGYEGICRSWLLLPVGHKTIVLFCFTPLLLSLQSLQYVRSFQHGYHQSGDQAAWRPHVLCSICFHSFEGFGESCTIVHGTGIMRFTASQCVLKCVVLTFSSTSSRLVEIW